MSFNSLLTAKNSTKAVIKNLLTIALKVKTNSY